MPLLLNRGIYYFENKDIPGTVLIAATGSKGQCATLVVKWPWGDTVSLDKPIFRDVSTVFMSLWLVEPLKAYGGNVYTIRNLDSGNYLACRNGYQVVVDKLHNTAGEHWTVTPHPSQRSYRITNVQYGTHIGRYSTYFFSILGQGANERWTISKPLSCSGADIDKVLNKSLPLSPSGQPIFRRLKGYKATGLYFIPSRGIFKHMLKSIKKTEYRKELFDCDDFTFEFKAAAATWYSDKVAIDGIPMFCGMIFEHYLDFAGNVVSGHAYNFLLSDDHSRLEYFEPQDPNGGPPAMPSQYAKSQPYLALC
jgi:hypothetical protein